MNLRNHTIARRGAAFVELIVVVGIISVLVAILVPMFMHAKQRATSHQCTDNLRQIGQAMLAYAVDNHTHFPCAAANVGKTLNEQVAASVFLLLKTQQLPAYVFVCPATENPADDFGGAPPSSRSNFTDIHKNLSYSMQNPAVTESARRLGFSWTTDLAESFAIMADQNPASPSLAERIPSLDAILPQSTAFVGNSNNHEGIGQNVLYADGRVEYQTTPYAGASGDNIYLARNNKVYDSAQDGADSILLPAQD